MLEIIQFSIKPGFIYNTYGPFTKNKKECKNLKEQEIQDTFIKKN